MKLYRIAGMLLAAGLALLLLSVLIKLLFVAAGVVLLARLAGGLLMRQWSHRLGYGRRWTPAIIAIDNPTYRTPTGPTTPDRIIAIQ